MFSRFSFVCERSSCSCASLCFLMQNGIEKDLIFNLVSSQASPLSLVSLCCISHPLINCFNVLIYSVFLIELYWMSRARYHDLIYLCFVQDILCYDQSEALHWFCSNWPHLIGVHLWRSLDDFSLACHVYLLRVRFKVLYTSFKLKHSSIDSICRR